MINRLSQIVNSQAYRNEDPKATRQEVATLYSAIHELALSNGTVRQNERRFVKLLGEGAFARVELCQLKEATVPRLGDPGNPGALPVSQARALQRNKGRVAVKCRSASWSRRRQGWHPAGPDAVAVVRRL